MGHEGAVAGLVRRRRARPARRGAGAAAQRAQVRPGRSGCRWCWAWPGCRAGCAVRPPGDRRACGRAARRCSSTTTRGRPAVIALSSGPACPRSPAVSAPDRPASSASRATGSDDRRLARTQDADGHRRCSRPAPAFADYVWGSPRDEPLQSLAESRWAVRNAIPLAPPGNIRMLDAIEERLAQGAGRRAWPPSCGAPACATWWCATTSRRSDDVPRPGAGAPGDRRRRPGFALAATFGPDVGGGAAPRDATAAGCWSTAAGRTGAPAIEVYEVGGAGRRAVTARRAPGGGRRPGGPARPAPTPACSATSRRGWPWTPAPTRTPDGPRRADRRAARPGALLRPRPRRRSSVTHARATVPTLGKPDPGLPARGPADRWPTRRGSSAPPAVRLVVDVRLEHGRRCPPRRAALRRRRRRRRHLVGLRRLRREPGLVADRLRARPVGVGGRRHPG